MSDDEVREILSDQGNVKLLARRMLRRAEEARRSTKSFFEFVLRSEPPVLAPIRVAPHQQLLLDFLEARDERTHLLKHDRAVVMMPVTHAKSFTISGLALRLLGEDPTERLGFVSATQGQAATNVGMVRAYIEERPELRLVYPRLQPSQNVGDHWTQNAIVVERPMGIRFASASAWGIDGAVPGQRWSKAFVDDILNAENTRTKDQRDYVHSWFQSTVLTRIDPKGGQCVVTNTPWHEDDLVNRLLKFGWPGLVMKASGEIQIHNTDWDSPLIRPTTARRSDTTCRLVAHDPDPELRVTLFPERVDRAEWEKRRNDSSKLPEEFLRAYEMVCRDDSTSLCKQSYVDKCKDRYGERVGYSPAVALARPSINHFMLPGWTASTGKTYQGIDLGIGTEGRHDPSAWFTFEVLSSGHRLLIDLEIERCEGGVIADKTIDKHRAYRAITRVETNGGQKFLKDLCLERAPEIAIKSHHTGSIKWDPIHGVSSLFVQMMNGLWLIPCDRDGNVHPVVARWVEQCLNFKPTKHTGDALMAMWFADVQAREFGDGAQLGGGVEVPSLGGSLGMVIMAR